MQVKNEFESLLTLHELYVEKSSFKREKNISDSTIIPHFSRNVQKLKDGKYELTFSVVLQEKNDKLYIDVVCKACFSIDTELHHSLVEKNAIAIIFPYVRSYISTITTQPGMTPIVLPPMNVVAMIEKDAKKID